MYFINISLKLRRVLILILSLVVSISLFAVSASEQSLTAHEQWLKSQFSQQHQALIPVVTVANTFFACNQAKKFSPVPYSIEHLVTQMDKERLADQTIACLGHSNMRSEQAINFALQGCFSDTFIDLPEAEKNNKLIQVNRALNALSLAERKKSLTECTTLQTIRYLK